MIPVDVIEIIYSHANTETQILMEVALGIDFQRDIRPRFPLKYDVKIKSKKAQKYKIIFTKFGVDVDEVTYTYPLTINAKIINFFGQKTKFGCKFKHEIENLDLHCEYNDREDGFTMLFDVSRNQSKLSQIIGDMKMNEDGVFVSTHSKEIQYFLPYLIQIIQMMREEIDESEKLDFSFLQNDPIIREFIYGKNPITYPEL